MERVLVVGAGFMGAGIAQVAAQAGCRVHLMDVQPEITGRALESIRWSLEKLAAKGTVKEEPGDMFVAGACSALILKEEKCLQL